MNNPQIYILISIVVLAAIMVVLILTRKKMQKPLSVLAAFAFSFVIMGVIFGDDRLMSYSLMGIGVVLAVIDIVKKTKKEAK